MRSTQPLSITQPNEMTETVSDWNGFMPLTPERNRRQRFYRFLPGRHSLFVHFLLPHA